MTEQEESKTDEIRMHITSDGALELAAIYQIIEKIWHKKFKGGIQHFGLDVIGAGDYNIIIKGMINHPITAGKKIEVDTEKVATMNFRVIRIWDQTTTKYDPPKIEKTKGDS